jgi:BirA family biotin operon repressor/biotin-[acetyl-CoA-carboxylase] ligase
LVSNPNPREEWTLNTQRLGRRVLVFDCLESTNSYAATLAHDPGNDGIVILAGEQTGGRGKQGRPWHCPPGAGVLMSILLFPPPELRRPALLTAWAAVSVCETIREITGLQAKIKWPNDIFLRTRKICGILIEQGRGTVVGIGLNVGQNEQAFADEGLPFAGSLAQFTGKLFDRDELAQELIHTLDREYDRLCGGDLAGLEESWKLRIGLLGKQVQVECLDCVHESRLLNVRWDNLELQQPDGKIFWLPPENVLHLEEI